MLRRASLVLLSLQLLCSWSTSVVAQSFGPDLRNTLMPASGAMGGASMARPQDVQSAVNGNPATLAQLRGTQFGFGNAWVEPTFNWDQSGGSLPNIGDFYAKSEAQGSLIGNIAVSQDYRALGLPVTVGMGLVGTSGAGLSLRQVPESNGTSALIQVLGAHVTAGVNVTERLAVGASIGLGASVFDAPFVGIGAATTDYGLRGTVGVTYDLRPETTVGFTYFSKMHFNFDDAIRLALPDGSFSTFQDVNMDMPGVIGLALADESLLGGRLLVAMDVLYFNWNNADLFAPIFDDQWALQIGTQYKLTDRLRLRLGYVLADRATQKNVAGSAGGVIPPVANEAIRYLQAQFPNVNQHRLSAGVGIRDMLPGVDLDIFAGGMPRASERYGDFTSVNLETYYIGMGITWRFGRGACCDLGVPDDWGSGCAAGCTTGNCTL